MTLHTLLSVTAMAVGVALALTAIAALVAKAVRQSADRRRRRHELGVRPLVTDLLVGGEPHPELLRTGSARRDRTVDGLLVEALHTVRGEARTAAIDVLRERGSVVRARGLLGRRSAVTRIRAAELLGLVGEPDCVGDLASLLDDRSPEVRWVAARSLGRLGHPSAVPRLLELADAAGGLPAGQVTMALWALGPAGIEPLRAGLGAASPTARRLSAELLGHLEALRATPELVEVLATDTDPAVRAASAAALGRIGSPLATASLTVALGDPDPTVVIAATGSLGRLGDLATLPALARLVGEAPSHDVARAAADALVSAGPAGRRLLVSIVGPGSDHARSALAVARLRTASRRSSGRALAAR